MVEVVAAVALLFNTSYAVVIVVEKLISNIIAETS
jgi:hypothetical protein